MEVTEDRASYVLFFILLLRRLNDFYRENNSEKKSFHWHMLLKDKYRMSPSIGYDPECMGQRITF